MNHRRPVCIIFFLFLGMFVPTVFAGGQREGDSLVQAEALIEEKKYRQAISLLVQEARANPQRLEEIQRHLRKIWRIQERAKERYAELRAAYEEDPHRANELIKELKEWDPYPIDQSRRILAAAGDIIGFTHNRERWKGIMAAAQVQLNQGLYWKAVLTYLGGFDLSRDSFDEAGFKESEINLVDSRTAAVVDILGGFARVEQPLKEHYQAALEAYNDREIRDAASYGAVLEPLMEDILTLGELLSVLDEAALFFLEYEESLRLARGDDRDIHHLLYLAILIAGRSSSQEAEGISGAVERLWREILEEVNNHTESLMAENFVAGQREYREKNDQASRLAFKEARAYSSLSQRVLEAWASRAPLESLDTLSQEDQEGFALQLSRQARIRLQSSIAEEYEVLMDHREVIDDLNRKKEEIKLTQEARALRTSLVEERPLLVARRNAWEDLLPDSQSAEKAGDGGELVLHMVGEIDALLRDLDRSEINLVGFMETIEREPLQEALAAGKKRYEEALSYLDGITITLGEGTSAQEILAHYPDRALEVLEEFSTEIDRLNQAMTVLQDRLRTDTTWGKPDIQAIFAEGETFLASLEPLSAGISRSLSRGREELLEANRLRQEGDRRFQEARQLTARNEFALAKERLTLAVNLYDQSLARQEVLELRRIRDQTIPDYFNEIRSRENSRVIQDVRGYLTQGQALYGRNEFAAANRLFLRAESRWRDTNANPNDEIVYWLELTQIALTVNSRRYLVSTDPLFTEISQYLNQATADYERGKRLLAGGNEEMANLAFDEAERNLFLVQQFFPYNKEVRILIIRIAQQRDSREFEELLGQDFKNAKAKIRLNPQEAYVELRNLEDLDPNFPGLQAAIEEAEYAAGIKIRPPDPVKMRRSRELYQQALAIVNSNVRTEFPMAQTFLNEAFAMSPTNQDILLLKDRVAVSLGGSTSVILTSVDQRKYTEAVDEFNNGNYLKAQILVDILLENANNRYNTRLLELKERIKSAR